MTKNEKVPGGTTLLVLVVDRSGSMQSIRHDMEGGIRTLLDEQAKGPGTCLVTVAQFDTEYELLFQGVPVAEVTKYELVPRGSTALLDAIGRTIGEVSYWLRQVAEHRRPDRVVFAVVTDGLENASREWSRDKVMAAVKERSDAGWQFTFLGANQDAIQEGEGLGVGAASAMTYSATPLGARAAMSSLSASVSRLRTGADQRLSYTEEERRRSGPD
jgi:Mg-chelatase subunit ChlD